MGSGWLSWARCSTASNTPGRADRYNTHTATNIRSHSFSLSLSHTHTNTHTNTPTPLAHHNSPLTVSRPHTPHHPQTHTHTHPNNFSPPRSTHSLNSESLF